MCLEKTEHATREESKDYFASSTQPIINWFYVYLRSWDFEFLTLRYCTRLTYIKQDARYDLIHNALYALHDRYGKSHFFCSILFHYWAAFAVMLNQPNRVNSNTGNSLPNIFSLNNFCLPTELCFIHSILILSRLRV